MHRHFNHVGKNSNLLTNAFKFNLIDLVEMKFKHSRKAFIFVLVLHMFLVGMHAVLASENKDVVIDEIELAIEETEDLASKEQTTIMVDSAPKPSLRGTLRNLLRDLGSTDFNWNKNNGYQSNGNYGYNNNYSNNYSSGNSYNSYNSNKNNYNGYSGSSSGYNNYSGSSAYSGSSSYSNNSSSYSNSNGGGLFSLIKKAFIFVTILLLIIGLFFIFLPKVFRRVRKNRDEKVTHYQRYNKKNDRKKKKTKGSQSKASKVSRSSSTRDSSAPKSITMGSRVSSPKTYPPQRLSIKDGKEVPRESQRETRSSGQKKSRPIVFVGTTA